MKKKKKKIVIAGGTGFIGQGLINYFGQDNEMIVLTRNLPGQQSNAFGENHINKEIAGKIRYIHWDGKTTGDWTKALDHADLLINLTGKTVNCRYTQKNKQKILESRIGAVKIIGLAIQQSIAPPKLWINAASATIYPHATDKPRDESFTFFENDFSVQVCRKWENSFYEQRTPFTRKVALRMAITLGEGGVMIPYFNLLKFGLGGRQGSGLQMYSWVHITDTCRMIEWIATHPEMEGTYNCVSPNAVSNNTFMKTLRKATGRHFGLPAYSWMIRLGAMIIGTAPELVIKSRWVLPTRILNTGYTFSFPYLQDAMNEIISKTPKKRYQLL